MKYIITYFPEFRKNALLEVRHIDTAVREKQLSANISLIETGTENFAAFIADSSAIFIRHIMPVHDEGLIANDKELDLSNLLTSVKGFCDLKADEFFSVQCRIIEGGLDYVSKDIEVCIGSYYDKLGCIPKFSDREITNFDVKIISVLIQDGHFYIGISKASENLNNHCDEYRVLSRSGREISRAENKLKEAINKLGLTVSGGRALDIGASPGGWSKVLADHGCQVAAVDPGDLHESLNSYPNITHYKDRIENLTFDYNFDLIVNDMNVDPQITSRIMCGLADHLVDKGTALVTLKLPFSDVDRSLNESRDILSERYELVTIKNLSHNRREVTALLRKK